MFDHWIISCMKIFFILCVLIYYYYHAYENHLQYFFVKKLWITFFCKKNLLKYFYKIKK